MENDALRSPVPLGGCSGSRTSLLLEAYCFESMSARERRLPRAQLRDCGSYCSKVHRLVDAVSAFRDDKELAQPFSPEDMGMMLGLSGELHWPLAGYVKHVAAECTLFALLYGVALVLEVAYSFDTYGAMALRLLSIMLIWPAGSTAGSMILAARQFLLGKTAVLATVVSLIAFFGVALFAALQRFLPEQPITQSNFQTFSAQASFFKWLVYGNLTAALLLVVPFHLIVRMQQKLELDRHGYVIANLTSDSRAIQPRDTVCIRPWLLWSLFIGTLACSLSAGSHLLNDLLPKYFQKLFTLLIHVTRTMYLVYGAECII